MLRKGLKVPFFHRENYKVLKQDDVFTLFIATEIHHNAVDLQINVKQDVKKGAVKDLLSFLTAPFHVLLFA